MDFIKMFISEYGMALAYMVVAGVFAYLGTQVKALADKYLNDKTKRDVARTVVQAVEQVYKDLHGEEKLTKALESASEMLSEKGIIVTELEMRMLIEAAVSEFNKAFEKKEIPSEAE
jgi:intergrase/recombinase